MKSKLLFFIALFLFANYLQAQQMDRRTMPERKADYEKFIEYPSGFSDSNTKAAADTLTTAEHWMLIDYSPLCDFKQITASLTQENTPLTKAMQSKKPPFCFWEQIPAELLCYPAHNCRRGFIANWVVLDNKLYLKQIRLWTPDILWQSVVKLSRTEKSVMNIPQQELIARLEKATKRSFNPEGLLFADWFTGTLLGETIKRDSSDNYRTKDVQIIIESGEVKGLSIKKQAYRAIPISGGSGALFFDEAERTFNNRHISPLK